MVEVGTKETFVVQFIFVTSVPNSKDKTILLKHKILLLSVPKKKLV
jgi:hypothetical protein